MKKILSILCVTLLSTSIVLGCQYITILDGMGFAGINFFQQQSSLTAGDEGTTVFSPISTNLPITFWFRSLTESSAAGNPNLTDVCLWYACGTIDELTTRNGCKI
jgi:hypothetical protein